MALMVFAAEVNMSMDVRVFEELSLMSYDGDADWVYLNEDKAVDEHYYNF